MNQGLISGVGKIPWRRERLPTSVFCLGNPRDRSAWLRSIASQRVGHDVALSHHRGGREYRNKGEAVKKCSAAMGLGPSPSRGNIHNNIFEFFWGTKVPNLGEDGIFRLSTRLLEHPPVTSPPTNLKKVTHPASLTQNFAHKTHP